MKRLSALRTLLPAVLKRPLRALFDSVDKWIRAAMLRRAVVELRAQARAGAVEADLIRRIRRAWGNESYSADAGFLGEVAARMLGSDGPFLDLGSGISTLIAGAIAGERGAVVWSVEQDADWCDEVKATLVRLKVSSVQLRFAPLTRQGDFLWYDLSLVELPRAALSWGGSRPLCCQSSDPHRLGTVESSPTASRSSLR